MIKAIIVMGLFCFYQIRAEEVKNLDQLLNKVREERILRKKKLSQRERRFIEEKNARKKLLNREEAMLRRLEKISAQLQKDFEKNEKELEMQEKNLNLAKGVLGEMFGVVKQTAGDFKGQFQNSVISADYPGRDKFMEQLAQEKKLADLKDLERLWFEIQREMTESGKVVSFSAPVVTAKGHKKEQTVYRIGAFNLVSGGKYLSYQSSTGQIVELPRQPRGKFLSMIEELESTSKKEILPFGLDPSRGTILGMLVQAPSIGERLDQGGIIGYIILCLLGVGIIIGGERIYILNREKKKMEKQLNDSENIDASSSVGQLVQVFEEYKGKDVETLEIKLGETILKTSFRLGRGIPTIKILSAVAPLLGLLGTVTGMISTFQSITLFGTGDPKLMAGGISTALVTTALGLVCAIPLILLHNFVSSRSKNLIQVLEEQTVGLLAQKNEGKDMP